MICQDCGVEGPTKYVAFHQNIGALLVRFSKSVEGRLCKKCIHRHFWGMTGTTFFLGWWGTISLIVTPFLLLNNVGRYLFCLRMPPPPDGSVARPLSEDAFNRIAPHAQDIFDRLNNGEAIETVTQAVADAACVTPGQVVQFIQAVARAQTQQ